MKDSYINHVLEEFMVDGHFDSLFGDGWIDEEQFVALNPTVCDFAFAAFNIDARGKYSEHVKTIIDSVLSNSGVVRGGDEYAGYWYKLRKASKQKYLEARRAENSATKLVSVLGEEALRRALVKIIDEDGLRSMSEKWEGDKSIELIDASSQADEPIPASDRVVNLNHNSVEYQEIAAGIESAIELSSNTRPNHVDGDRHASILRALEAAQKLWESFQLTRLQAEIGIIMALEKAQEQLAISFKMARGTLLVEAIKVIFGLK